MLDGYWEMWLTQCLARYLKAGMTVVDVGANFGYYTLLCGDAVGENGRVIAVEPNPDTVDLLRETVNLNGLSSRTTIVPNALGSKAGRVLFYVPDSEPKNATIVQRTGHPGGQTIEVSAVTLDEAAKSAGKVDVVKIDAEGGEIGVIAGMKELIARDRPTIFLEFNAARYSNPRAFLDTLLASYGSVRELTLEGKLQAADISAVTDRELIMDRLLVFEETAK
jgi:FkbM family methyltransferase